MLSLYPTALWETAISLGRSFRRCRFSNADLTEDFFEKENWNDGVFPGPWRNEASLGDQQVRRMSANPTVFGAVPMSVYSYGNGEGDVQELAIHFLDAGQYFGYRFGGEKTREEREAGSEKRNEFSRHFREISKNLRHRLEEGCGRGRQGTIGRSDELRTVFTQYQWENFVIRLVARQDHSVSVYIMREGDATKQFMDDALEKLGDRERAAYFSSKVHFNEQGDRIIADIPMFTQGNTPFCGVHSLAMTGHYLGLRVHPETLAAGAGFKNTGSAKGSDILDLYRGVGDEIGMKVSIASKFDLKRVLRSIEAGIPVIVWRRVSMEREAAHTEFQRALQKNPGLTLSMPTETERISYPPREAKGSPSHASVISGINPERNEVIFTEPWGEFARNRRMRIEEMEATAYAVFFFKL